MKKQIVLLVAALLMSTTFVLASAPYVWSLRGDVTQDNLEDLPSTQCEIVCMDLCGECHEEWICYEEWECQQECHEECSDDYMVEHGRVSAYISTRRHEFQSQGNLYLEEWGNPGNRFSLNWNWKGDYAVLLHHDDDQSIEFDAWARVNNGGMIEHMVPITVVYHKMDNELDIQGPDFEFEGIYVKNLA
jgi:hypothetical protein